MAYKRKGDMAQKAMLGLGLALIAALGFITVWDTALPGSTVKDGSQELFVLSKKVDTACQDGGTVEHSITLSEDKKIKLDGKEMRLEDEDSSETSSEEFISRETSCSFESDKKIQSGSFEISKNSENKIVVDRTGP